MKESIAAYYAERGVRLDEDEIFVSDGAKSDLGNMLDLFAVENTALIPDPVYPVYVDTNVMAGRRVLFMDANEENGFLPLPDYQADADIIYLCSPNNPTGAVYNKEGLLAWVDYAIAKKAVIFFDAAYEAFIGDPELPRSIYSIPGAKRCAIEFCSFSKFAGFTGTRCGYTVVPPRCAPAGSTKCGCAGRPPSSTACRTSSSAARRPPFLPREGGSAWRISPIIKRTRASWPRLWKAFVSGSPAAGIRRTFGCAARTGQNPGRFSTCC